jgi:C4-dicarboxylate-specific signal transduction histidine kinase
MRRAVQHLAAERADIVIPDYGTTLTDMAKRMGAISESLKGMAGHPAMQMTPDSIGNRIAAAAEAARRSRSGQDHSGAGATLHHAAQV